MAQGIGRSRPVDRFLSALSVPSVLADGLHAARPPICPASPDRSPKSVPSPVRAGDRLIGTLNFYDRAGRERQPVKARSGEPRSGLMVTVLRNPVHKSPIPGQS